MLSAIKRKQPKTGERTIMVNPAKTLALRFRKLGYTVISDKENVWAYHPEQNVLERVFIIYRKGSTQYRCKTIQRIGGVRMKTIVQRWF